MSGDLTTIANVKQYLGITVTTADAKLQYMVTACSSWVKSFLNRDVLQQTYTEVLDGTGTPRIMLANYPVTAISQVLIDQTDVTVYALSDGRRKVTLVNQNIANGSSNWLPVFRRDLANVTISYTAGYATVPADLEHIVCRIVAWGFKESERPGQVSKSMSGEVVTFSQASVPPWALTGLNQWKKVVG